MYEFLGGDIFKAMVIIVTRPSKPKYQHLGFEEEDIEKTKEVLMPAYETITGCTLPQCPPVLYLQYAPDPDVIKKVVEAKVILSKPLRTELLRL